MYVCTGVLWVHSVFVVSHLLKWACLTVDNIQNDASTVYVISNFRHFLYVLCFLLWCGVFQIVECVLQFSPHTGEVFLISNFRCVLYVVCFLLWCRVFRKVKCVLQFPPHRCEVTSSVFCMLYVFFCILKFSYSTPTCLWRWNRQSVPKRRHIKFRHRGITQKKTYRYSVVHQSLSWENKWMVAESEWWVTVQWLTFIVCATAFSLRLSVSLWITDVASNVWFVLCR
jgi:hypothetical protein